MAKYVDIADDIRNKIKKQEYTYGQKLPYEYTLCAKYKCNKETMKKALEILVKEGLIIRRRGAGTFVKNYDPTFDMPINNSNNNQGLTERMEGIALVTSDILAFDIIPCNEEIAHNLSIEPESFVYHIQRLRKLDGKPYILETLYMPQDVIPGLKPKNIEGSIYYFIEKNLKLKVQSTRRTLRAALSGEEEQEYLNLKPGEPYIETELSAYLNTGVIFEYALQRMHFKDFEFHTIYAEN